MDDAVSPAHLRGATPPPHAPSRASHFSTFTARLGTFLLAAVLGTGWAFTLFDAPLFLPYSYPSSWWPLFIGVLLAALLCSGVVGVIAIRRTRAGLARYLGGVLVALVCSGSILALTVPVLRMEYGWLLQSSWAGAIAIVVTYVVAGLRAAPQPYQRYANLGYGVASWVVVTALTLPVPDQGFTTLSLLGLPFAALGGLVGGALHRAFLGSAALRRRSRAPSEQEQGESGARDALGQPGQAAPEAVPRASVRPAASRGLAWRLLAAGLLGICAVPFGPEEPVALAYSLLVLGFFAGIAIVLDLSLLGWRPGLLLLLGGVIAIAWGGGSAIVHTTGPYLFASPMGAVTQEALVAFVGICALLCVLAVDGAHLDAGREPADRRTMVHLARQVVFWLAAGLFCWLGIATILLWRGWPGMLSGSETPGQIALAGALPLVVRSLPAALLGALVGGAVRWALLHATAHLPFNS
jgi:hypothetical protein